MNLFRVHCDSLLHSDRPKWVIGSVFRRSGGWSNQYQPYPDGSPDTTILYVVFQTRGDQGVLLSGIPRRLTAPQTKALPTSSTNAVYLTDEL